MCTCVVATLLLTIANHVSTYYTDIIMSIITGVKNQAEYFEYIYDTKL